MFRRNRNVAARNRGIVALGVAALAAPGFGTLGSTPAKASPLGVTFGVPTLADAVHTYGEPDINFGSGDQVMVSGPTGTGTQRSMWNASFDS
jgi:hypothetical protein